MKEELIIKDDRLTELSISKVDYDEEIKIKIDGYYIIWLNQKKLKEVIEFLQKQII